MRQIETIGYASIGRNARSSDFNVDKNQQIRLSLILDKFKNLMLEIGLDFTTIEIKVEKETELTIEEMRESLKELRKDLLKRDL